MDYAPARVDELVSRLQRDAQLQQRPAQRPGERVQWLAWPCAPGRLRVVGGWVGDSPLQVHLLLHPLLEQPVGIAAQALYPGKVATTERRGIGEARCLVQQLPGMPLHGARALVDGVGQVPRPRARDLVEQRAVDGLRVVF